MSVKHLSPKTTIFAAMSHYHDTKHYDTSTGILGTTLLNGFITLVEFVGGIFSNSLALISDAVHNLSDTLALALAWVAIRVGKRQPNERRTFGYKRFEILMQSTSDQIKLDEIKALIENHPMVNNIHHVHCWQLQDNQIHFEAHLEISEDISVSRSNQFWLKSNNSSTITATSNIRHCRWNTVIATTRA
jgi:Co/Zn/Cd efflux system component